MAKIRALSPSTRVLLRTELGAGHGGPSGRYDAWKEEALVFAFLLDALGMVPPPGRLAGAPAVTKRMVNGVWKPGGRATGVPSTEAASTVGAPTTRVTGPVAATVWLVPGLQGAGEQRGSRRRVVASTQHAPDVAERVRVNCAARHLVRRSRGRADCGGETAGAGVVVVVVSWLGPSTVAPPLGVGGRARDGAPWEPPCANRSPGGR